MASTLKLEVVTPTGPAVKAETDEVEAPGVLGEFGVLPGHLPMLAALKAGVLQYRVAGKLLAVAVGPGFAEVGADKVTLLTDVAVDGSEVDVTSTRTERDDVLKRLETLTAEEAGIEYDALIRRREWLDAQLDAARLSGKSSA